MSPNLCDQSGEGEEDHPLLQVELDVVQLKLLHILMSAAEENGKWPIWDYLSRKLTRESSEDVDGASVLRSLPVIRTGRDAGSEPYGLVWIQGSGLRDDPKPEERVGLTVAGLMFVKDQLPVAKVVADGVSWVIGGLARLERELPANPDVPAQTENISMDLVRPFYEPSEMRGPVPTLPDELFFGILENEYVTVQVQRGPGHLPTSSLRPSLRPYRGVQNAADYMRIIGLKHSELRPDARLRGDELPLMLDYVSYVLASRDDWQVGHMIQPPDLRCVGSLFKSVNTEAEFHVCLSDLATLMQRLNVPESAEKNKGNKPGTLVRLREWLQTHIEDPSDRADAVEAIEDVRRVLTIRNGLQHPSQETMINTVSALAKLNIANPIRNWGAAWDVIRARVADAFDTVRQRV